MLVHCMRCGNLCEENNHSLCPGCVEDYLKEYVGRDPGDESDHSVKPRPNQAAVDRQRRLKHGPRYRRRIR